MYRWLRQNRPVAYLPAADQVLVTTWELCEQAGNNDTVFSPDGEFSSKLFGSPNVLALNGPEHTAMRNRVNPPFRPRAVRGYRESLLRTTARSYIDGLPIGVQVVAPPRDDLRALTVAHCIEQATRAGQRRPDILV
jgi:cytochrome P450